MSTENLFCKRFITCKYSGKKFDFDLVTHYMCDLIRENVNSDIGNECVSDQEFYNEYCLRHELAYAENFVIM